jgi:hypothetical protein
MKRMLFLGALVLGVSVCSQSFGFEILDRMLGCKKGGTSCTEPSCGAGNGCAGGDSRFEKFASTQITFHREAPGEKK